MSQPGNGFHFIFIVDCSGSMSGSRMTIAKEALDLFVRSLPLGCSFSIIEFGSTFNALECKKGKPTMLLNEQNRLDMLERISKTSANLGGTDIEQPLEHA